MPVLLKKIYTSTIGVGLYIRIGVYSYLKVSVFFHPIEANKVNRCHESIPTEDFIVMARAFISD